MAEFARNFCITTLLVQLILVLLDEKIIIRILNLLYPTGYVIHQQV
jgi:hypothetical protein